MTTIEIILILLVWLVLSVIVLISQYRRIFQPTHKLGNVEMISPSAYTISYLYFSWIVYSWFMLSLVGALALFGHM